MAEEGSGPAVIRSVAVTAEDVVAAVESHHQREEGVVLRVTPPFSGRMRARIHVSAPDGTDEAGPVHIDPAALLDDEAPPYPRPADTGDDLRGDPDVEYTVDRHHERHREALERWRDRVPEHVRDRVTLETSDGPVSVDVAVLG